MNIKSIEFDRWASFRLSEDLLSQTNQECKAIGIDRSALIRSLLEDWLEDRKASKKVVIKIKNSVAA